MTSNVPESAIDDLNAHTSSDNVVSDRDIQRVADFIELVLLKGRGDKAHQAKAKRYFKEMIVDYMCEFDIGLCEQALDDHQEAGVALLTITRGWIRDVANYYFDEFADEARNLGWIE